MLPIKNYKILEQKFDFMENPMYYGTVACVDSDNKISYVQVTPYCHTKIGARISLSRWKNSKRPKYLDQDAQI